RESRRDLQAARGVRGAPAAGPGPGAQEPRPGHREPGAMSTHKEETMRTRGAAAVLWTAALIGGLGLAATCCAAAEPRAAKRAAAVSDVASAAMKVYVAPGDLDEYYMFASGGHSGQVYVYGLPSGRHISTIPVFTPYPATGYGFDDDSKKMLGEFTWGD